MCRNLWVFLLGWLGVNCQALAAPPTEQFLKDLPPGTQLLNYAEVQGESLEKIASKLGGKIAHLSNANLRIQGRNLQLNTIAADSARSADKIYANIKKAFPFALKDDRTVIEFVGKDLDADLAVKTSFELGLIEKPDRIQYEVQLQLGLLDECDYTAVNDLFNAVLAEAADNKSSQPSHIAHLKSKFTFGKSISLRHPDLFPEPVNYRWQPLAKSSTPVDQSQVRFSFEQPPQHLGIPYARVAFKLAADDAAFRVQKDLANLQLYLKSTESWPSDEPMIREMVQKIIEGKTSIDDQVAAILKWLTPGRVLKYEGKTGSRWGVRQTLRQKFGHCWDFSDCFVTMCRSVGIPCRQVSGWLYGSSGHVWAEYYRAGEGWMQVDPTAGDINAVDIYHIPFFTTDDGKMPFLYMAMPEITMEGVEKLTIHIPVNEK